MLDRSKVPKLASIILQETGASGLGQNNGREAKQIIGHVHVHIIPRYKDRGSVWTKRSIPDVEDLDKLAKKIRARF